MLLNRIMLRAPDGVDGVDAGGDLEGDDIRNQLGADWEKMGGASLDGAPPAIADEKPVADPAAAVDPAAALPGDTRARDASGKFIPAGEKPAATDAPLDQKPATAATDPAAVAAAAVDGPLKMLPAADQAAIAKLPPEAKKIVGDLAGRLMADHTTKTQTAARMRAEADPILKIFEPHREALALANQTPHGVVERWAAAEKFLQRDPVEAVTWLVSNYLSNREGGVEALIARLTGETDPRGEPVDPVTKPLLDRIDRLESHLAGRVRDEGAATTQRTLQTIDQFLEEKDQAGKPVRPYANDVLDDMIALSKADRAAGKQPTLPDLYERAVWSNKAVRDRMLADQATASAETNRARESERVAAARRAGSTLTGSPSPNGARDPSDSIRGALSDAWDNTMGTA